MCEKYIRIIKINALRNPTVIKVASTVFITNKEKNVPWSWVFLKNIDIILFDIQIYTIAAKLATPKIRAYVFGRCEMYIVHNMYAYHIHARTHIYVHFVVTFPSWIVLPKINLVVDDNDSIRASCFDRSLPANHIQYTIRTRSKSECILPTFVWGKVIVYGRRDGHRKAPRLKALAKSMCVPKSQVYCELLLSFSRRRTTACSWRFGYVIEASRRSLRIDRSKRVVGFSKYYVGSFR